MAKHQNIEIFIAQRVTGNHILQLFGVISDPKSRDYVGILRHFDWFDFVWKTENGDIEKIIEVVPTYKNKVEHMLAKLETYAQLGFTTSD
jgi:hypothetical protein